MLAPPEENWMKLALQQAEAGFEAGEVPVGAVILESSSGRVVARAHHQTGTLNDPTAHAVMIALTQLASALQEEEAGERDGRTPAPALSERAGSAHQAARHEERLILVTTREPCLMCAGAILLCARVHRLIYGAAEPGLGSFGSALDLLRQLPASHSLEVRAGVLECECAELLRRARGRTRSRP